jgi:hypothetical protein
MKASESRLRKVKQTGKMGGLHKDTGYSGFSGLSSFSGFFEKSPSSGRSTGLAAIA